MKALSFATALLIAHVALSQSVFIVNSDTSVFATSVQRSPYIISAAPGRGVQSQSMSNWNRTMDRFARGTGARLRNRNFNSFNMFSPFTRSVYMWGNGWLGTPVINNVGSIGRPEIDTGSFGRPGIDTGINPNRPIPRRSLQRLIPNGRSAPAAMHGGHGGGGHGGGGHGGR